MHWMMHWAISCAAQPNDIVEMTQGMQHSDDEN